MYLVNYFYYRTTKKREKKRKHFYLVPLFKNIERMKENEREEKENEKKNALCISLYFIYTHTLVVLRVRCITPKVIVHTKKTIYK